MPANQATDGVAAVGLGRFQNQPGRRDRGRPQQGSPPAQLGRYHVVNELGRGAMGLVLPGKDPTIQRFVAIKTMRLDDIDSAGGNSKTFATGSFEASRPDVCHIQHRHRVRRGRAGRSGL